jgi:hypothetical protein
MVADLRTNIRAIFRASDNAIELADGRQDHGRARLQRDNPLRGVVGRHDKPILLGLGFEVRAEEENVASNVSTAVET